MWRPLSAEDDMRRGRKRPRTRRTTFLGVENGTTPPSTWRATSLVLSGKSFLGRISVPSRQRGDRILRAAAPPNHCSPIVRGTARPQVRPSVGVGILNSCRPLQTLYVVGTVE